MGRIPVTELTWQDVRKEFRSRAIEGQAPHTIIKDLQSRYSGIGPVRQGQLLAIQYPQDRARIVSAAQATIEGLDAKVYRLHGRDHLFQIPSNPKGLVVWLPGCARSGHGFWPHVSSHPVMKGCFGFPEDVSHTKQTLRRGYAILVQTPSESSLCWTSKTNPAEVIDVVNRFRAKYSLTRKPLFLFGASSGGGYLPRIAPSLDVQGLVYEVSTNATAPKGKQPPSVWVTMHNDPGSAVDARKYVSTLRCQGCPAGHLVVPQRAITSSHFSDQLPAVDSAKSSAMAKALSKSGLVDSNGVFRSDPKLAEKSQGPLWPRDLVRDLPWVNQSPATAVKSIRTSPTWQVLTAAYARHEHAAMFTTAILEWLEHAGKGDLDKLSQDLVVLKPAFFSAVA